MDPIEIAVRPVSPFRLTGGGGDRTLRANGVWMERLLVIDGAAMVARVRQTESGECLFTAEGLEPGWLEGPGSEALVEPDEERLLAGLDRLRFAVGVDQDLTEFYRRFREDPILGPAIRGRLERRARRRPLPWEALFWAITEQLIEYRRAAGIQRQIIRRWGIRLPGREPAGQIGTERRRGAFGVRPGRAARTKAAGLSAVPGPEVIAELAPAELAACDLSPRRALAAIMVAREVSRGRADPADPGGDRRLLAIRDVGPWTIACLGLRGRGDPDALPAGDLGQVKLVGYLLGLGRLAEVEEVESFYRPYAPYRGLAGDFLLGAAGESVHGPGSRARIRHVAAPPRAA